VNPILFRLLTKMPKILLLVCALIATLATWVYPIADAQEEQISIEAQRPLRKEFQSLELFTARQGSWIFPLASPPKIVWRDAEAAQKTHHITRPTHRHRRGSEGSRCCQGR
jgi:hypothetical protein